jgi:hypothetical protein
MAVESKPAATRTSRKQSTSAKTLASVFIIESVSFDDERAGRLEGSILRDMLELSGKATEYFYIRTKSELEAVLDKFRASTMRYLHISCHGNEGSLFTTLDELPFVEFGELVSPYLKRRRLFISACEAVNGNLADAVMPDSGCFSIIGPARDVGFDEAAVMWTAFYHLMFKQNPKAMKGADIRDVLEQLVEIFETPMTYIRRKRGSPHWQEVTVAP